MTSSESQLVSPKRCAETPREDPVALVMRALGLSESERDKAIAIVEGRITYHSPLAGHWVGIQNGDEIAQWMASWISWTGELMPRRKGLGAEIAEAFPFLWYEDADQVTFPKIACVTPAALSGKPLRVPDSFAGALAAYFTDILARERDRIAPILRRLVPSGNETEKERTEQQIAEMTVLTLPCDRNLWGPESFASMPAPRISGEPPTDARVCRWRWMGFSHLSAELGAWHAAAWAEFQRTLEMAVVLRSRRKPGERHGVTDLAHRAAMFWRRGNFPLLLTGSGSDRTLYVLVKPTVAN